MRRAGDEAVLRFDPGVPKTNTKESLDFDRVRFNTAHGGGLLAVEVSYREAVVEEPQSVSIGPPYYEPFQIPVLTLEETTAEKLRTLTQRRRASDLAHLALIIGAHGGQLDRARVRALAAVKFQLVKQGDRRARIESNVEALRGEYEATVPGLDPEAAAYGEAKASLLSALPDLLP